MFWHRLLWFKTSDLKLVSNADVCLFLCQFKAIWSWAFDPVWSSRAQLTTAFLIFSRFLALLLSSSKTCTHFPTKQNRTNLFMSLNPGINDDNSSSNISAEEWSGVSSKQSKFPCYHYIYKLCYIQVLVEGR